MIRRFPGRAADDPRRRRRERLAALFADAAPETAGAGRRPFGAEEGERLAAALAAAGPVFAGYGHYLATRPDLLPAESCLALAAVPDAAPPLAADEVLARLAAEWAGDPWTVLRTLEPAPLASRLATQSHRAVTADGRPVVLVLLRPGAVERAEEDGELLEAADAALAPLVVDPRGLAEARAGYRRALAARLDLAARAATLGALGDDGAEAAVAPAVDPRLSTARLLVRQDLGGRRLDELSAEAGVAPSPAAVVLRRLALAWLRQALLGRLAPVELGLDDVEVLADGRLAWLGGVAAAPPPAVQEHLWEHLAATASEDVLGAGDALLRELDRGPGAVDESELMLRLRQVVPFRDGAWSAGGDSLPEHLFAAWRIARQSGWRLRAPALELTRGVAALALLARRLAPDDDPLAAAVGELRLARGLGRLRGAADPRSLGGEAAGYAALALAMPQKLDALLSALARGELAVRLEGAERPRPAGGRRGVVLAAVAAAALAVGLVVGRLAASGGFAAAEGGWEALVLLLAGGWVLRALSRGD